VKAVVIGGTAFVGRAVVEHLSLAGHEVHVFHRGTTNPPRPEGVQEIIGDRRDLFDFRPQFQSIGPEVVIDMINMTEHHAQATNDTFSGIAARQVVISSQDVYRTYARGTGREPGPPDPVPITEDSPLRESLYPYRDATDERFEWSRDYEKIMVERVALAEPSLPATVLRLPAVYGPGDYQHRLLGYLSRMIDNRPAIVVERGMAEWRWTRGYVDNVAAAVRLAAESDATAGQVFNVGEASALTEIEWIQAIGRAAGWQGKIAVVQDERFASGLNTAQSWEADTSRFRLALGFEDPIPLDDGLRHTVEWERANVPEGFHVSPHQYEAEDEVIAQIT
jgi:nucleoside-diphosphate-sugar epimerase